MQAHSLSVSNLSKLFMHHGKSLLMALLLCSVGACTFSEHTRISSVRTETHADFSQLKTYRWDFSALGRLQPEGGHIAEMDSALCGHVDKHLAEKGYRRVETGPADFTLDYRVVVTQKEASMNGNSSSENAQRSNEYGLRWSFDKDAAPTFEGLQAPRDKTVLYRYGELHIAAFEAQGRTIWYNTATRILEGQGSNEAERRAAVRIAVDKLMDEFPAAGK